MEEALKGRRFSFDEGSHWRGVKLVKDANKNFFDGIKKKKTCEKLEPVR
jgi:hypothetical protein